MTDYDEFIADASYRWEDLPDLPMVYVDMNDMDSGEHPDDRCPGIIDFHYRNQHFVVVPFVLDDEMTMDVAMFDAEGTLTSRRLISTGQRDHNHELEGYV